MTDDKGVATSWLEELAARGVRVTIRNGRLSMHPASAYKALTDAELIALRHHREAIKLAVREGFHATTTHEPAPAPVAEPAPPPEPDCVYCGRRCIGPGHDAYATLHYADPLEARRRDQDALDQFLANERGWPLPHMIRPDPEPTEEEKRQAEARRKWLGDYIPTRKA